LKKTYLLKIEGKHPDRLLDAAKHDIRKYAKRERAKPLPEGVDFCDFDCKVGASATTGVTLHFAEVIGAVDALAKSGADQCYVEVTSKPGHRSAWPVATAATENDPQAL
jgi:Family of unknown function (DUF6172)